MEADSHSSSLEIDTDSSGLTEPTESENSSYGEKISEVPISSLVPPVIDIQTHHLNEISTSNFQFDIDESFLPFPTTSKLQDKTKQQKLTKTILNTQPIKIVSENKLDDSIDLKELLQLLDEQKVETNSSLQKEKPVNPQKIYLKQVKIQNSYHKPKSRKNDMVLRQKNESLFYSQKDNYHSVGPQTSCLIRDDYINTEKLNTNYPNKWPSYQSSQFSIQNRWPYQQDNMPPVRNPKKQYREEFASQNFMFWGVLISIKLCSFLSLQKNVLLVPFSSSNLNDSISKEIAKRLKYNIKEILNVQTSKNNQKQLSDGYIFSVKAKGLEKNYRGIYFLKSPPTNQNEGLKYYSVGMLKKSIKSVFDLINSHMEEDIIFPDFEWGSLNQNEICETLIWSIFREINENRKNCRCLPLKEVIISVNSCEHFQLYSKWLNSYVFQLRG